MCNWKCFSASFHLAVSYFFPSMWPPQMALHSSVESLTMHAWDLTAGFHYKKWKGDGEKLVYAEICGFVCRKGVCRNLWKRISLIQVLVQWLYSQVLVQWLYSQFHLPLLSSSCFPSVQWVEASLWSLLITVVKIHFLGFVKWEFTFYRVSLLCFFFIIEYL